MNKGASGIRRVWRRILWGPPIRNLSDFSAFVEAQVAHYIQAPLFRHAQAVLRMGLQGALDDARFQQRVDHARWLLWPRALADLVELVMAEVGEVKLATVCFDGCTAAERGEEVPTDSRIENIAAGPPGTRIVVAQRLCSLGHEIIEAAPPPTALSLAEWKMAKGAFSDRMAVLASTRPREIRTIPVGTARRLFAVLPIVAPREDAHVAFLTNQMVASFCSIHERLFKRVSRHALLHILLAKPAGHAGVGETRAERD